MHNSMLVFHVVFKKTKYLGVYEFISDSASENMNMFVLMHILCTFSLVSNDDSSIMPVVKKNCKRKFGCP